ncbi:hypothetical protein J7I79_19455 [Arthrobacter sp. ISL-69]|nr:hypothetical protein [Arthrobacter sp. ISL-69]
MPESFQDFAGEASEDVRVVELGGQGREGCVEGKRQHDQQDRGGNCGVH